MFSRPKCVCISSEIGEHSFADDSPLATVTANKPNVNILPLATWQSPATPQVAAATAAAMGVLTPQPCIPVIPAPWMPGSSGAELNGESLLTDDSKCNCQWAGLIEVNQAGQDAVGVE